MGTNLADIGNFTGYIKLIWNQTKPLLKPPHVQMMMLLCTVTGALFFVAHGALMW